MIRINENTITISTKAFIEEPVRVAVLFASYDDLYTPLVKQAIEMVQKEKEDTVQYTFFDGQDNQSIQNEQLNEVLMKGEVDLILLNVVNLEGEKYANRIKENNLPVIVFGTTGIEPIKAYTKAYWIGTAPVVGGILQGKILVELWNSRKEYIDRNKDNVMQYIMLKGKSDNIYTIERTKNSILTANKAGIMTQELASQECNGNEEEAKEAIKSLFLKFGNNIEVIIANNDAMAIGAIKALQEYGYNLGDEKRTIYVVGFDGIEEARDLIKKGIMAGTVVQDPYDYAKAFYEVGMNLVNNRNPLLGTDYKFGESGVSIILEHKGLMTHSDYIKQFTLIDKQKTSKKYFTSFLFIQGKCKV